MELTISLRDGGQDKAHYAHNMRDPRVVSKEDHIDPAGHFEVWVDKDIRQEYEARFGDAVERYNAFQTRKSRRITSYYDHVRRSKQMSCVREMIVAVGNSLGNRLSADEERSILREYVDGWNARNPNLPCVSAVLHQDEPEAVGHVHLQYYAWYDVPLEERKNGLDRRAGLAGALLAQGFEKVGRETAQTQWVATERAELERIVRERGHEIIHPGQKRQHLETDIFKLQTKHQELTQKHTELKARHLTLLSSYERALEMPAHMRQSIQHEAERDAQMR